MKFDSVADMLAAIRVHAISVGGEVEVWYSALDRMIGFTTVADGSIFCVTMSALKGETDPDTWTAMRTDASRRQVALALAHRHGFFDVCDLCIVARIMSA